MATLVDEGIRGVTSNPTIFAKAIEATDLYDDQVASARRREPRRRVRRAREPGHRRHRGAPAAGLRRVRRRGRLRLLRGVAHAGARHRRRRSRRRGRSRRGSRCANLFVKVPATDGGLPAIAALLAEGISVNVTLIFGLERYAEVIDAFLVGPRAGGRGRARTSHRIASVASFFVSRVDTEVDGAARRARARPESLQGRAAVAQAQARLRAVHRAASPTRGSPRSPRAARGRSGRCGRRRRRRTPRTPTCSTSTR